MGSEWFDLDWDAAAEAELRSIEQSYAATSNSNSKRRIQDDDDDDDDDDAAASAATEDQRRSKGRRLPSWANHSSAHQRRSCGWALSRPTCRSNLKAKYPQMNFGGRVIYCRTAAEAEQAAMDIFDKIKTKRQNEEDRVSLGFDIEWRPTFRQGEAPRRAAVMQLCMDNSHCYVIHIIRSGIPPILRSLLEDSLSVKVGVCIANDAMKISRDYDCSVEPLDDLSEYANFKLAGISKRWSLSSLTEELTCKELAKPPKIRMGDWEATPLSKEQLQYAATDAFASWYLYEVLKTYPDIRSENDEMKNVNDTVP